MRGIRDRPMEFRLPGSKEARPGIAQRFGGRSSAGCLRLSRQALELHGMPGYRLI